MVLLVKSARRDLNPNERPYTQLVISTEAAKLLPRRLLGVYSRPDFEIVLVRCKVTSAGTSALVILFCSCTLLAYLYQELETCNTSNLEVINREVLLIAESPGTTTGP
jgi:hypothetical protein